MCDRRYFYDQAIFCGKELNDLKKTPQRMVVVVPESELVYEPAKPTTVSAAAGGERDRKMPVLRYERHR